MLVLAACTIGSLFRDSLVECDADVACPTSAPRCVDNVCRADDGEGEEGEEGEGEEGEGEGEGEGCPVALPPDYRCVDGVVVCAAPADDGLCRIFVDDNCPLRACVRSCGGETVPSECVEAEPGAPRSARCPSDSVDVASCECTSKCDCDVGEVCVDNVCAAPPAQCNTSSDCPRGPVGAEGDLCEAFACNGFNDRCVTNERFACEGDADCAPTCLPGAICSCANAVCVAREPCNADTAAVDCGNDSFCDDDNRCTTLPPSCVVDADCGDNSFVCDPNVGCVTATLCGAESDCAAPFSFCDSLGRCALPSCRNGGVICPDDTVCNDAGRCVVPDALCTSDTDCTADRYCNLGSAPPRCTLGCRNDNSCATGEVCTGDRICVRVDGNGGGFGDVCVDDTECDAPLLCGAFTATCSEACSSANDCAACNAAVSDGCICSPLGFCVPQ